MTSIAARWRKPLALAVAGVSMLSVAAASASELTVWCWDPNFNIPAMTDAGARYTKDHPDTTFNINNISQDEINQKLQTQLLAGVSDGLPDIVLIQDDNAQRFLQSFPGAFVPLSAGALDMAPRRFYTINVAAIVLWACGHTLPGVLAVSVFERYRPLIRHYWFPVVIVAGLVAGIAFWAIRRRRGINKPVKPQRLLEHDARR